MKKRITDKQRRANLRNGKHSTGPKTQAGKEKVRWNAIKHGLLSNSVIEGFGESKEEQESLLTRLIDDFAPVGELEMMLVDKIATCYLRLRRAMRGEVGTISRDLRNLTLAEEEALVEPLFAQPNKLDVHPTIPLEVEYKKELRGVRTILALLQKAESEIVGKGLVIEATQNYLYHMFGIAETSIATRIGDLCKLVKSMSTAETGDPQNSKEIGACRVKMIEHIKKELEGYQELVPDMEYQCRREYELKREIVNVPVSNDSVKAQRYETMIDKEFYQAIDRLEKIQKCGFANENSEVD